MKNLLLINLITMPPAMFGAFFGSHPAVALWKLTLAAMATALVSVCALELWDGREA